MIAVKFKENARKVIDIYIWKSCLVIAVKFKVNLRKVIDVYMEAPR